MDAVSLLRGFYLFAASSILIVYSVPALRNRFIAYGARASKPGATEHTARRPLDGADAPGREVTAGDPIAQLLDHLASYRVPHRFFTHFYLLSVCMSAVWAFQIWNKGHLFQTIGEFSGVGVEESVLTDKAALAWCFMLIQGLRRLVECITLAKPSSSQMWIGHWLIGLLFYTFMSVSVWIEASPALLRQPRPSLRPPHDSEVLYKTVVPTCLFFVATTLQHRAHRHLANMPSGPNYTVPTSSVFNRTLTPHYFAECLIYFALALLASPEKQAFNKTIASGLVFVVVNLGVSANETYKWYERTFGANYINGRARMIPFLW